MNRTLVVRIAGKGEIIRISGNDFAAQRIHHTNPKVVPLRRIQQRLHIGRVEQGTGNCRPLKRTAFDDFDNIFRRSMREKNMLTSLQDAVIPVQIIKNTRLHHHKARINPVVILSGLLAVVNNTVLLFIQIEYAKAPTRLNRR